MSSDNSKIIGGTRAPSRPAAKVARFGERQIDRTMGWRATAAKGREKLARVLISSWPNPVGSGGKTAPNGAPHPEIGLAGSLYLGIVIFMYPHFDIPNPSRIEMAARRAGHAGRRYGPHGAPARDARRGHRAPSQNDSSSRHFDAPLGISTSAWRRRNQVPPYAGIPPQRGAQRFHLGSSLPGRRWIIDARGRPARRCAVCAGIRFSIRVLGVSQKHSPARLEGPTTRREGGVYAAGKGWEVALAAKARPAHVGGTGAARRRRTRVPGLGSD